MKWPSLRRWLVATAFLVVALGTAGFLGMSDSDVYLKIDRGINQFGRVYKEITANYVDDIDPEKFMQAGIDGMLGTLDPYTVYISSDESDEVEMITSGKYGGIGVTLGLRDGVMRIINVMEGYSAQRQGILPGDILLEVDGVAVSNKKADEVRNLTRGDPGTEVRVKISREGVDQPMEFVLLRQEIQLHNVTYADYVAHGIGYIRLEHFSRKAGEEVRQALKELKVKGDLEGLVLDVRGNPGGLLESAVEVVGKFVPKGSLVVSTRGRTAESEKKYYSSEEPVTPDVPMIVLTDRGSASASEIVAGALQDLDRAVVMGTRTYGKGLVQTILPLSYGAQLKVTTARYYTPSGRCIQEIDYQHHDKSGVFSVMPDSLRKRFATAHGRTVFERGGIAPDSIVTEVDEGPMIAELFRKALFFKFTNHYFSTHKTGEYKGVDEALLQEFRAFLVKEKFDFVDQGEGKVKELRKIAEDAHYSSDVTAELDRVSSLIGREKDGAFDRYRSYLVYELTQELVSRVEGETGRIKVELSDDSQLNSAVGLLKDAAHFKKKLQG